MMWNECPYISSPSWLWSTVGNSGWYTGLGCSHSPCGIPNCIVTSRSRVSVASSCVALTVPSGKWVLVVTVSRRPFLAPAPSICLGAPLGKPKYTETYVMTLILSVRGMIGSRLPLKQLRSPRLFEVRNNVAHRNNPKYYKSRISL
jgi:hypothetical protein